MKSIEELYKEINGSEVLKKALEAIKDKGALAEFLKKNGCEAPVEDFIKFVESQGEGEIGDDDAKSAAGGWKWFWDR